MAIAGRSREQIRASVGTNLGSPFRLIEADAAGTNVTFLTDELSLGGADEHLGKWLVFTSGTNDGEIRRVTDSDVTNNRQTLTFFPSASATTANGDTVELWDEPYNPEDIHEFINQAILDVYGAVYDPVEDISLHSGGNVSRLDIPSGLSMLKRIEWRSSITSKEVHGCERVFDETTDSDFTIAVDTENKRQGNSSLKLTVASGASAGDVITDSITSLDLSKQTHLEGWVLSTTALSAADYKIHLDSGTAQADGTDLESLDIPAASADTWTYWRVPLANPETDTALISIGIEMDQDKGAHTVWFDGIQAVANDTAIWTKLLNSLWHIDKESRDLILTSGGRKVVGYSLLKLVGGDEPALLTADGTANEINDTYVIARATALALVSGFRNPQTDPDAKGSHSAMWAIRAEQAQRRFPTLQNVRRIE